MIPEWANGSTSLNSRNLKREGAEHACALLRGSRSSAVRLRMKRIWILVCESSMNGEGLMRDGIDFTEWEERWARRRIGVDQVKRRARTEGMTRPARDPDEAAFLKSIGRESPFVEVERPGYREWLDYKATPPERRNPPGLTAADFARPFLDAERAREEAEARFPG